MNVTLTPCTIIRRSENTNAFGLRGYWAIESKPVLGSQDCRVFSFATSESFDRGQEALLAFIVDDNWQPARPAYELTRQEGAVHKRLRPKFIRAIFPRSNAAPQELPKVE